MRNADLQRYIQLYEQKHSLEDATEDIKKKLADLEIKLLAQFTAAGVDKITLEGRTLWVQRMLWAGARDGNTIRAVEALKAHGLAEFCREQLNVQGLSAFVRERDKAGDPPVPEGLAEAITVAEKFSVRVRKAQ